MNNQELEKGIKVRRSPRGRSRESTLHYPRKGQVGFNKIPPDKRKESQLRVRVSWEEKAILIQYMKLSGLTVSQFLRAAMREYMTNHPMEGVSQDQLDLFDE